MGDGKKKLRSLTEPSAEVTEKNKMSTCFQKKGGGCLHELKVLVLPEPARETPQKLLHGVHRAPSQGGQVAQFNINL